MTSCKHCKQRLVGNRVTCKFCNKEYHTYCISKIIKNTNRSECCRRAFATDCENESITSAIQPRLEDQLEARVVSVADTRGYNPDHTLSSCSSLSPNSSIMEHSDVDNELQEPTLNRKFDLPQNWAKMDQAERDATLFQILMNNQSSVQTLVRQQNKFHATQTDHAKRIALLEKTADKLVVEKEKLKELRNFAMPTSELKVNNIPPTTKLTLNEIAVKLLEIIGLQDLCRDILVVRALTKKKSTNASLTEQGTSSVNNSNNTVNINTNNSFVIKFKSCQIRQHVLQTYCAHGNIQFSMIDPSDTQNGESAITVYEMLPAVIHNFLMRTRAHATALGYKFTWGSNATVYVRKSEKSPIITITTEEDWKFLV